MDIAILEAKEGIKQGHGGPFGAVVVKDGVIVGRGHNQVLNNNDPTCHGEMMAIHDACKTLNTFDLKGCEIYTTGEPCPMCYSAILWANIDKIYYGCTLLDNESIGFRDAKFESMQTKEARENLSKCVDREACLDLFEEYKSIKNKINY